MPTSPAAKPLSSSWNPITYNLRQLMELPPPSFLIDGFIVRNGLNVLVGPPGVGKTFIALDMALSAAHGRPWLHAEAKASRVVYVAAEGHQSLAPRAQAWCRYYGIDEPTDEMIVIAQPLNLMRPPSKEDIMAGLYGALPDHRFIRTALFPNPDDPDGPPIEGPEEVDGSPRDRFVIVDTLARCSYGGDENSASDMGVVIDTLDFIRRHKLSRADEYGPPATMLVVHHTSKAGLTERGSTALRGAADSLIRVAKLESAETVASSLPGLRVITEKQKDAIPEPDLLLTFELINGTPVLIPLHKKTAVGVYQLPWGRLSPNKQKMMLAFYEAGQPIRLRELTERLRAKNLTWGAPYIIKLRTELEAVGYIAMHKEDSTQRRDFKTGLTQEGVNVILDWESARKARAQEEVAAALSVDDVPT